MNANGHAEEEHQFKKLSFVDDEAAFRHAYGLSDDGRGQLKTTQVRLKPLLPFFPFPPSFPLCFPFGVTLWFLSSLFVH